MPSKFSTDWTFSLENEEEFRDYIDSVKDKVRDLSPAFRSIASNWFKGNRRLFTLKGSGRYQPLAPVSKAEGGKPPTISNYKEWKKERYPNAPILVRTGVLKAALTKTGAGYVLQIGNKQLVMGINDAEIPYAKYHNSDRKPRTRIPQRKVVFISGGDKDPSKDARGDGGDIKKWRNIVAEYIEQVLEDDE